MNADHPPPPARDFAHRLRWLLGSVWGAVLGAACYGAWTAWVNWHAGAAQALLSAGGHMAMSAPLTYYGAAAMRASQRWVAGWRGELGWIVLGGLVFTYAVLLLAHALLGTPDWLLTLAPGVLPNLMFCGTYAALLVRTPSQGLTTLPRVC